MKESNRFNRMSMVRIKARLRNVSPMKPHIVRFMHNKISVKAKSLDGKHILVIEFDWTFATDRPGGPKILMADSVQGSIFTIVARVQGEHDCVMQSFQNCIDRLGLVKAELKCDQEPNHS